MENNVKVRIVLRHDTTRGWKAVGDTTVLLQGEIGIEFISDSKVPKFKIGDGTSSWNALPYFSLEATLPESYSWNDLLGIDIENETSYTSTLMLKKPAYKETVNIKDINDNYDVIDDANAYLNQLINTLAGRLDSLITNYPEGENITLENEIKDARIRFNGDEYGSAGSALRAVDEDLNQLSQELSQFVGSSIPDGLYYKNNLLYLTSNNEIISDPVEIVGGGGNGGGSASSYVVTLTNLMESRIISVSEGVPVSLKYSYSSADNEGYLDGNGTGILFVNGAQQASFVVPQGENELDITKYLKSGTNAIKLQVTNSEGAYRSLSYTVNILVLSITTTSSLMATYNVDSVGFQYTVTGSGTKQVHFLMDGKEMKIETVTSSGQSRQFLIPRQPDGDHILEVFATIESEGNVIKSNVIRAGMVWYSDKTVDPIILINSSIEEITQGETISLSYLVFHPSYEKNQITQTIFNEDGTIFSENIVEVSKNSQKWEIQTYPVGNVTFKISCERISNEVQIKVNKSSFDREIYQDNLLFEFNARDRQNTETNPAQWNYGDIHAEFTNIGWANIDGWMTGEGGQGILRLLPKSSVYIPFYPFNTNITATGYTIEVEIATQNVCDYDSIVLESYNNGRGFIIKSQSADFSGEQTSISAQFKEDSRIRLTFVVEQNTFDSSGMSTSTRLVYIYINGILCGIQQYAENDNFAHSEENIGITIGSETCGIDVYFIRFYNIAFNADMQLNNFIVDRPSLNDRIAAMLRNDIIDTTASDLNKKITLDSLKGANKYIIMKCPELPQSKGDKKKDTSIEYIDPQNSNKSFTAEGTEFDVQGTSSAGYPVKNFKIKLKKGILYLQSGKTADGYEFTDNSLTSAVLCLKADYASSENANNVCLVDFYNTTCPFKMPPQLIDERIRQGIDGQPILLFWLNTETNELKFWGKYNMNDDKSNENVFGFEGIDFSSIIPENEQRIECWEWKNNNGELCLFKGDSKFDQMAENDKGEIVPAWQLDLEPRYPDLDNMYSETDAIRRVIAWVASTREDAATSGQLAEPKYYKTRDTSWDKEKIYYTNSSGVIAEIKEKDSILSYNDNVIITKDVFYTKMGANSYEELIGGYTVQYNTENSYWQIFKNEELIIDNIINIGEYGIAITDSSILSFAFEYKIVGEGWNTNLYEYYQYDTPEYRLSKFKAEFEDYFELQAMTYFYVFTEVFLMIDNRAKNMFLTTFNGTKWFPIPYDFDSAIGINNEGALVFDYNLEDTDKVDGSNVYNGQDSTLWINFRKCFFSEITDMYRELRSQDGDLEFSYDKISTKMRDYQKAWAEVIWNLDQEIKYLQPFFAGSNNLAMAQGNKETQRDFWLFNAFKYRDSKYQTGDALDNNIHLRIYNKGEIEITPYSHIYARVKFGNAKDTSIRARRNEKVIFNTEGIAAVNDLETLIYSSDRISKLGDLSGLKIGYCDFSKAPKLQSIIVGSEDENYRNGNLKTFTLGASTLLQEVDVSNCYNLGAPGAGNTQSINASQCPCLEVFKARGTQLKGVTFSNGGRLRIVRLPETITNLTIRNQTQIEELSIDSYENISTLWLENAPNLPIEDLILNTPKLERVRLFGLEWHTDNEETLRQIFNKLKTCKGLGASGNDEAQAIVSVKVHINSISEELLQEINSVFPEMVIVVNGIGKYYIQYVNLDRTELYHYIADQGSNLIDPIEEGFIETPQYPATEDTIYTYKNWRFLPENIQQSYVIVADYYEDYKVQFFDTEDNLRFAQWIRKGEAAKDPIQEGWMETPTLPPSPEFTYVYINWGLDLNNIQAPAVLKPQFLETINYYIVQFFGGEKQIGESQFIPYGGQAQLPNTEDVKDYYYDQNTQQYEYYAIHNHIGWDINEDGQDDGEVILIKPQEYSSDPIVIKALFSSVEPITDSWAEIKQSCQDNSYKSKYLIGTQKEIGFTYNGKHYTGIVEIVNHNYDTLEDGTTAALTFVLKDIFLTSSFRNNSSFTWNGITGPLAGGWSVGPFDPLISNIIFDDEDLNNAIVPVIKKTDFGPLSTGEQTLYYPTSNLSYKIWTPSATEMGVLPDINEAEEAKQGGNGSKKAYAWFTNNKSRIKFYNNEPHYYWTRTYAADSWRFYGVGETGGPARIDNKYGIRSFDYAGLIFGFCIN